MARSTRLYEQRRHVYEDLGVFLEGARLRLYAFNTFRPTDVLEPGFPSNEEWAELQGRAAVNGSGDVQAKFAAYHSAESTWDAYAKELVDRKELSTADPDRVDLYKQIAKHRKAALAALEVVEEAMRDELAEL